jgi:hypothetical protein
MKANELRIGNYVYPFDDINLVSEKIIFRDAIKLNAKDFKNTNHLEQIPLTEEWLLKFGFKHSGNGFFIHTKSLLELSNIGNEYFLSGFKGVSLNKIYHVHQLQNLYFALTNEELKLTKK